MPVPPTFDVRVTGARPLSPQVRELALERADGAPFVFEAGQWVSLVLPLPEGEVRRAYSISSPPDGSPGFRIAVTKVTGGPGSTYLHGLAAGGSLRAVGPQGFFTRPPDLASPCLFVATGTGVAPLRSMMLHAASRSSPAPAAPMWLLFGVRTEADILYRDDFEALAARAPNVRLFFSLSRPGEGWKGRAGYVQEHVKELWGELGAVRTGAAGAAGAPHAYVCGLEKMVGAVRDVLRKGLGVPRQQVHSERYD